MAISSGGNYIDPKTKVGPAVFSFFKTMILFHRAKSMMLMLINLLWKIIRIIKLSSAFWNMNEALTF